MSRITAATSRKRLRRSTSLGVWPKLVRHCRSNCLSERSSSAATSFTCRVPSCRAICSKACLGGSAHQEPIRENWRSEERREGEGWGKKGGGGGWTRKYKK